MYDKMMESICASDKTEAITNQMKLNRDFHLKEIIDLKESHSASISQYEQQVADLMKQREESNERIELLEDEISKCKCEIESLVEHDRLNKREFELKTNILKYEQEKEIELLQNKIKSINIQHDVEINCINEQRDRDITNIKNIYIEGLDQLKSCHLKERNQLEDGISKLQNKVENAINNIVFSESSLACIKKENNLESIPSERESSLSETSSKIQMLASSELEDNCKFNIVKIIDENNLLKEELQNIKFNVIRVKDEQIRNLETQLIQSKEIIKCQTDEIKKTSKQLKVSNSKIDNLKKGLKLIETGCKSPDEKQIKATYKEFENSSMHYSYAIPSSDIKLCDFDNKIFMTRRELDSVMNTPPKEKENKFGKDYTSNKSMIYELTNMPIDLSQIHMSNTKHISMLANRIETEVSDGEIYLKHFFRMKENNDNGKSCMTEKPCSRGSSINRSTNTIALNTVKKNLNDTFNNLEQARYSMREHPNDRDDKTVSASYIMR